MKKAKLSLIIIGILLICAGMLSAQLKTVETVIDISPNPMDKFTSIAVRISEVMNVSVNVETDTGVVIKSLFWGHINESINLTWDRYANDGSVVPAGKYYVVVNYPTRYTSTKKTLILK